jgi:transcriptional regulator with XRE-family HTH domain
MAKDRTYSKFTKHAVQLLGQHIKLARQKRQWTQRELAERAGVGRSTVQKVESGHLGIEIGLAFEIASIAGIPLFTHETSTQSPTQKTALENEIRHAQELLTLLPNGVHKPKREVDDDF